MQPLLCVISNTGHMGGNVGSQTFSLSILPDSGATVQRRDLGPAAEHPPPEDPTAPPPRQRLLHPGGCSGHAGEAGVRQRHGPRPAHHHRQSQGEELVRYWPPV